MSSDDVLWGEQDQSGELRIFRRAAGAGASDLVYRLPAPTDPNPDDQRFIDQAFLGLPGALAASPTWLAAGIARDRCKSGGDVVDCEANSYVIASRGGHPFRRVLSMCGGAAYVTVAAEGSALIVGQTSAKCRTHVASRIWSIDPKHGPVLVRNVGRRPTIDQVALAGRWVGWLTDWRVVTVADRTTGRPVFRVSSDELLGSGEPDRFALDRSGRVVVLTSERPHGSLWSASVRDHRPVRISRRVAGLSLAANGDHVLFEEARKGDTSALVLASRNGRAERTLDRLTPTRWISGDVTLSSQGSAVWSVGIGTRVYPAARGAVLRAAD